MKAVRTGPIVMLPEAKDLHVTLSLKESADPIDQVMCMVSYQGKCHSFPAKQVLDQFLIKRLISAFETISLKIEVDTLAEP